MTQPTSKRILSGIQPTNNLTIGNYLGAIKNWIPMQDEPNSEALFCIVDLHAITTPQDPESLRNATQTVAAAYLASGIDPKKSHIFIQSHVRQHTELAWILGCSTPMGWLNRMTQFKDKAGKHRDKAGLGLYGYPTLMAADILLYDTTHVPVGDDQKQHVELTRDIAQSINSRFEKDVLVLPEPVIKGDAKRIMSLRDGTKKMSKSDPSDFSRIHLTDSNDEIAQKIKKAKTDPNPLPESLDDLQDRPEAKNLLTIYAAMMNQTPDQALVECAGKNFSDFKPILTDALISHLTPIREKIQVYSNDPGSMQSLLDQGADHAREIAEQTVQRVKNTYGFLSW